LSSSKSIFKTPDMITTMTVDSLLDELRSEIFDNYETIHQIVEQHAGRFTDRQRTELVLTILGMDMPTVTEVDRAEKALSQITSN